MVYTSIRAAIIVSLLIFVLVVDSFLIVDAFCLFLTSLFWATSLLWRHFDCGFLFLDLFVDYS